MAKVEKFGEKTAISLDERELKELNLLPGKEFEIAKAKEGLFVLLEKKPSPEEKARKTDERIFYLIRTSRLSDLVEEKFEKLLNKEEQQRLQELVKKGIVLKFKLSADYKKAVYRLKERKDLREAQAQEKPRSPEESALEKEGYLVVKNEELAKRLSSRLAEKIKRGEIRGIKDFDGNFFIVDSSLYKKSAERIASYLAQKKRSSLEEIEKALGMKKELVRGVCELLKEEGEVCERRKEKYEFIE